MASICAAGPVTCSAADGSEVTQRVNIPIMVRDGGSVRADYDQCYADVKVCVQDAVFGFHGAVSPGAVMMSGKCAWQQNADRVRAQQHAQQWSTDDRIFYRDTDFVGRRGIVATGCRDSRWDVSTVGGENTQLIPDPEGSCPPLGKNPARRIDVTSCPLPSERVQCTYARDTIAGGCGTAACVREGIETFSERALSMSDTTVLRGSQRVTQDLLLATLVQGLRDGVGDCGQEGKSCLALLNGECEFLAARASDFQARGRQALYKAFKDANETCTSEAGLRDRPG